MCWNGECLTRLGEHDEHFQHLEIASKTPRHIRKRDVAAVKGGSSTKSVTTSDDGTNFSTTTTTQQIKTVKTDDVNDSTSSFGTKGFRSTFTSSFSQKGGTKGAPTQSTIHARQFSLKSLPSTGPAMSGLFSANVNNGHTSSVKNGGVNVVVRLGPNGERITTRTVKRIVIKRGPTKTVRRIIIHKSSGGSTGFMQGGINGGTTRTISLIRRPMGSGRNVLISGSLALPSTKTTKITTVKTVTAPRNPIQSLVRTVTQERISGGTNQGGISAATKTVSTVAVAQKVQPSASVVQLPSHRITPSTSGSLQTESSAALKGLEVEVPGYTAGLRHNWKWVLARRVGMYPPYVQVVDPDVLFYKLGLRKPYIPALPVPVQDVLNRVPVHPVGSDLYGFLLSSSILEKIRGFTDRFKNGLSRLNSMLSTTNASQLENSNLISSLFTSGQSSPLGSPILQKIIQASLSASGSNPVSNPLGGLLSSTYGNLFSGTYNTPYGSPWSTLPGSPFPASSWPLYARPQIQFGGFGRSPPEYPGSSFGLYESSGTATNPSVIPHTSLEDDNIFPGSETLSPKNVEGLLRNSNYLKTLLAPRVNNRGTTYERYNPSYDESTETASDKFAKLLAVEKLRHLLKMPRERDSITRSILHSLNVEQSDLAPVFERRRGVPGKKELYKIIRKLLHRRTHGGIFSPYEVKPVYGTESDNRGDLVSELHYILSRGKDDRKRYVSAPRTETEVLELLNELPGKHRTSRHSPVYRLLQEIRRRQRHRGSPDGSDNSDVTSAIEDILTSSERRPSSTRTSEITKEITKALLRSRQGPVPTGGRRDAHLSKIVSVHGASHLEARPQRLTEAQVFSTTYQTNKGPAITSIPYSPVTMPSIEATRSITQQSQAPTLIGINGYTASASGASPLQPYAPFAQQPVYSMDGSGISNQAALLNHQYISSTGGVYGSPVAQPATTLMSGTGFSGYSTMPSSAAYVSQYTAQPYYIGTSLYGSHPHYVVEGHEAPGTRWQLRVWRHHPGVSYAAPGFNSFGSSHLGSVVTKARETVTRGLQLGTQPGHFGFATFAPATTQPQGGVSGWTGATSQYMVRAADGSLVLTRQPLPLTPSTSGAVVSQITKTTTKTTSGSPFAVGTGSVQSNLYSAGLGGEASKSTTTETKIEAVKQQISAAANGKSELLSDLSQNKASPFSDLSSDSGTEGTASSSSATGSSSNSLQTTEDLSQSKVRR